MFSKRRLCAPKSTTTNRLIFVFHADKEDTGLFQAERRQKHGGQSVFYDCEEATPNMLTPMTDDEEGGVATEKQDGMKPDPENITGDDSSEWPVK